MSSPSRLSNHTGTHTISHSNNNNSTGTTQSFVRKRTRATAEQLAILEETFAVNVSPNSKLRKQLSEKLNMNERSIQIWFQNRRAKVKHMQKKAHMQMHQAAMRAQFHHYYPQPFETDTLLKQPLYFSPHYMMKPPMMNYGNGFLKSTPPPPDARSSFPTPDPPMYYNYPFHASTPPPHLSSQESLNQWYSPTSTAHPSPVIESNASFPFLNNNILYQQQLLEEDFLALDHGPISPSPSVSNEDTSPSPIATHQEQTKYQSGIFSMPSSMDNQGQSFMSEPSLFSESEIWISTPEVDTHSDSPSIPCYPSFSRQASTSQASTTGTSDNSQEEGLNVSTLIVGNWRRMKYRTSDLSCCFDQDKFIWFIEERGHRFKIEIPVQHISKIEHTVANDVCFRLTQLPLFYMKTDTQSWLQCSDFTENKQASQFLCHTLEGPHLQQDLTRLMNEYPHLSKLITLN